MGSDGVTHDADAPHAEATDPETARAVDAVRLLGAVLEDSPHNRQSMIQISGATLNLLHEHPIPSAEAHALEWSRVRGKVLSSQIIRVV